MKNSIQSAFHICTVLIVLVLSACGAPASTTFPPTTLPSTVTPSTEAVPTPTTDKNETQSESVNPYGMTNNLDKFADLPNGYILYGNTSWTNPIIPYGGATLSSIKDAVGMEIPFDYADLETYPSPGELRFNWAYKIGKDFTAPLTLLFVITASLPADGGSFTFDPGPNPQLGQKWEINQDVMVNNEIVHILSADQGGIEKGAFGFTMQSDSNIIGANITDLAHPPEGGGGGGGDLPEAGKPFRTGFYYQMPLPQGPLTLTFTNVIVLVSGDWSLTWTP